MSSLYSIQSDYLAIQAMANDESIPMEQLVDSLEMLEGEMEEKLVKYGFVIKDMELDAESAKSEIERLTAIKRTNEKAILRMKAAIIGALNSMGISKINHPIMPISIRAGMERVEIDDVSEIPDAYIKVTESADKAAIKKALKSGLPIPGARIERGEPTVKVG